MLISETLFLYSIDEESKKTKMKNFPILLAGAILFDLELEGIITIQPFESVIIGPLVHLEVVKKTGNQVFDAAIDAILSRKRDFPIPYWLTKFRSKNFRKLTVNNLIHNDPYFHCADFDSYCQCQAKVSQVYSNREQWVKKSIINVACSGQFSSDRTITDYAQDIWNIALDKKEA